MLEGLFVLCYRTLQTCAKMCCYQINIINKNNNKKPTGYSVPEHIQGIYHLHVYKLDQLQIYMRRIWTLFVHSAPMQDHCVRS